MTISRNEQKTSQTKITTQSISNSNVAKLVNIYLNIDALFKYN